MKASLYKLSTFHNKQTQTMDPQKKMKALFAEMDTYVRNVVVVVVVLAILFFVVAIVIITVAVVV